MSRSSRSSSSEKQFSAGAGDLLLSFFIKTVMPLIPMAGLIWVLSVMMNMEVSGTYRGVTPLTGSIELTLNEENEELTGELILKHKRRYEIVDGKMVGENKMEINLTKESPGTIVGVGGEHIGLIAQGNPRGQVKTGKAGSPSSAGQDVTIQATKDQNDIDGVLQINGKEVKFRATRSSFSSFFGKRWMNRGLKFIGIKINPS